ncbi:hypothetical protein KVV02_003983 [Mortierella alpina]|uniref:Ubiquitin-like protease family profile domain-containing protein n=1 Tax=Mortierella alpina TaxID=64518 RepID=A0A9P8A067_MORAP|nr:hypothetical protein KVV02_003983 [Mortierella alpina]
MGGTDLDPSSASATPEHTSSSKRKSMVDTAEFSKRAKYWLASGMEGLGSLLKLIPLDTLAASQQQKVTRGWVGAYPDLSSDQQSYYIRGVPQEDDSDREQVVSRNVYRRTHSRASSVASGYDTSDDGKRTKPYQLEPYTKLPTFTAPDFRERSSLRSWSPSPSAVKARAARWPLSPASPTTTTRSLLDEPINHAEPHRPLRPSSRFGSAGSQRGFDHDALLRAKPRVYAGKTPRMTSLFQSKYTKDVSLARQRLFERHSQQLQTQDRLRAALDETIGTLRSDRESYTSSRKNSVQSTVEELPPFPRIGAYGRSFNRDDWGHDRSTTRSPKLPAWLRTKRQGDKEPSWLTNMRNLISRNLPSIEQQPRMPAHQKVVEEHDRIEKELAQRRQAEQFAEFTDEEEDLIDEALSDGYGQVVEGFNVTILKKDIHTLRPGEWLNDEVINFYGNLILARSKESTTLPKIHVFSTFFYKTLSEQGYDKVKRWTKKVKIFELDYVLIPIHCSGNHWTTAVIDMKNKRIEYYDSLLGNNPKCFLILRGYLEQECQDKLKKPFDFQGWENDCPKDIPRQKNGFDCGVFTCTFLECKSRGLDQFDFSQQNMPYLRKRMILNIINKSL